MKPRPLFTILTIFTIFVLLILSIQTFFRKSNKLSLGNVINGMSDELYIRAKTKFLNKYGRPIFPARCDGKNEHPFFLENMLDEDVKALREAKKYEIKVHQDLNKEYICVPGKNYSYKCLNSTIEKDGTTYSFNRCKIPSINYPDADIEPDGSKLACTNYSCENKIVIPPCAPKDIVVKDGKVMCKDTFQGCYEIKGIFKDDKYGRPFTYDPCSVPFDKCPDANLREDGSALCNGVLVEPCRWQDATQDNNGEMICKPCKDTFIEKNGVKYPYNTCKVPYFSCLGGKYRKDGSVTCSGIDLPRCHDEWVDVSIGRKILPDGTVFCNTSVGYKRSDIPQSN